MGQPIRRLSPDRSRIRRKSRPACRCHTCSRGLNAGAPPRAIMPPTPLSTGTFSGIALADVLLLIVTAAVCTWKRKKAQSATAQRQHAYREAHVKGLAYRTFRRRSQRDRARWERIVKLADEFLPQPRTLHPWPNQRFDVDHPRWAPYAGKPHVRCCTGAPSNGRPYRAQPSASRFGTPGANGFCQSIPSSM